MSYTVSMLVFDSGFSAGRSINNKRKLLTTNSLVTTLPFIRQQTWYLATLTGDSKTQLKEGYLQPELPIEGLSNERNRLKQVGTKSA